MTTETSSLNFFHRMLLRDYAFIEKVQKRQPHHVNLNFAEIAAGGWMFLSAMTLLTAFFWLLDDFIPSSINIARATGLVRFAEIAAVVVAVSMFVSRIARPYRAARPAEVDEFATVEEQRKWWITTLSVVPIVVTWGFLIRLIHREG